MTHPVEQSKSWFERAMAATPGGVNSPVRAFNSVGGTPRVMVRGEGAYLWDADGTSYVDLVSSWGPMILGHAHPRVVDAVRTAAGSGLSFGTPSTGEVELAEEIIRRVRPVEQLRLVNSGTEATMSAIRLARAYTGRSKIIKFAGCYHGHVDALLAQAGSGVATQSMLDPASRSSESMLDPASRTEPASPGVTEAQAAETIVVPYNDVAAVRQAIVDNAGSVAAIVTEAAAGNMGVIAPEAGFNAALRDLAHEHGALLIIDEVLTGFRVSAAGWYGLDGVAGDLYTFGKVASGGLPAAAFGGRADVMAWLAPVGSVYQAGTLAGNPVAVASGLTTLREADEQVYRALDANARRLGTLFDEALTAAGVAHQVSYAGNLVSVFFTDEPVRDYASAAAAESWRYAAFFHALLEGGVYPPPSNFEAYFVNAAMDDAAFATIEAAVPAAARAAAAAEPPS